MSDWIMNLVARFTRRRGGPRNTTANLKQATAVGVSEPVGDPLDPETTTGTPIING